MRHSSLGGEGHADSKTWAHAPGQGPPIKTFLPAIVTPQQDYQPKASCFGEINKLRGDGVKDSDMIAKIAEAKHDESEHDGPEYNNTLCAKLAKNKYFEYLTLMVIGINSLWIGYDTDANNADNLYDADPQFPIAENFFCVYFTFEVFVRLVAFKNKFDILRPPPCCGHGKGVDVVKVRFATSGIDYSKVSSNASLADKLARCVESVCLTESGLAAEQVRAETSDNGIIVELHASHKAGELKQSIVAAAENYTLSVKQALGSVQGINAVLDNSSGSIGVTGLTLSMKVSSAGDFWIKFDSFLVVLMIAETWIMPFVGGSGPMANMATLRLLRLLRITRMARLMRSVPELMTIVKGMAASVRSVGSTMLLLVLITYVFAIIFTGQFHDVALCGEVRGVGWPFDDENFEICEEMIEMGTEQNGDSIAIHGYFGSMQKTMMTLFIQGTLLDDVTDVVYCLLNVNEIMLLVFIVFILISSFTMLNMLIGILVEVVQAEAAGEKQKAKMGEVTDLMDSVFNGMDKDGSGKISLEEFKKMSENEEVVECLKKLDIEAKHLKAYQDILFPSGDENLNFKDFMQHLFRLRPGTAASVLDIEHFRKDLGEQMDTISEHIETHVANLMLRFGVGKNPDADKKDTLDGRSSIGTKRFSRKASIRGDGYHKSVSNLSKGSASSSLSSHSTGPLGAIMHHREGNTTAAPFAAASADDPSGSALRTRSGSPPPEPPIMISAGDSVPSPPTDKLGSSALDWSGKDALEMLESTPSSDIVRELTRRLGPLPSSVSQQYHMGSAEPFQGKGCKLQGPAVDS